MDFTFTSEQDDAAELAARILEDKTTVERLQEVERAGDRFDERLWATLSEAFDWSDLGLLELCRVVVEVGRTVAPVPLAVHGPSVLFLTELGVETGARLVTAAVSEELTHLPARPTVTASETSDGVTLSGVKTLVRAGMRADAFVVTATTPDGTGVFLVESSAPGVTRAPQRTSDGDVTALVTFADAPAVAVGTVVPDEFVVSGRESGQMRQVRRDAPATRLHQLITVCAAAEQLGVTEGALSLTASYAKSREQFGRPIGTFQAVSQRLADGYIDVLGQRLTLWQAVWRLAEGLPAETEVATAKLWAADAGHELAHTAVHVHGGVGIDLDGEAHRYFTSAKRFEFSFGGATEQALTIGRQLATEPV